MAIVVGTDSYLSVADADAYWLARNNATWAAASNAEKEKALIESTQYIDGAYNFIGVQIITNVLAWPRNSAHVKSGNFKGVIYDSDTIPPQVENACAELSLDGLSSRLRPTAERGGAIKRERVEGAVEIEYSDFAPSHKTYDFVSMIIKPLLTKRKLIRT